MTTAELPSEDLPLLTRVIDEAPDDLPTLTEMVSDIPPPTQGETPAAAEDDLPVLMEAVAIEPASSIEAVKSAVSSPSLGEADIQRLAQQLEEHLESVLAQKLGHRLEQLQRLAVEQAVSELKAELPQILRDALQHSPNTTR
jgi:hypothetical protein